MNLPGATPAARLLPLVMLGACATPAPPLDAGLDASASHDRLVVTDDGDRPDPRAAWRDVPRDRADATAPRCYGVAGAPGLLTHVGSIPRESGGLSNGGGGCVGDVDNDGRREYLLPRMGEPSELIGADLCAKGRVLLPDYARDCVVADVDGAPGNELVVISNVGWTQESRVAVGRVEPAGPNDRSPERFVWRALTTLDERRPVSPIGAPHAAVTDLDRDGRRELVVAGSALAPFLRVWTHEGGAWSPGFTQDLRGALDETNGLLQGDLDGDGDTEALLLGGCSGVGRGHLLRVFDAYRDGGFRDTPVEGPAMGALAELDGVAPPELVMVERVRCDAQRPGDASALQVRRHDPATGRMALLAARGVQGATPEASHVAAVDVTGSSAPEILLCATPLGSAMTPRTCRLFAFASGALTPVPDATAPFVWSSPPRRSILASIVVDDLDGDGAREVFLQAQEHVEVLRGPRR
ncbi:MAG: VCBS repeat-containing protein [Polyangiales bacterium]